MPATALDATRLDPFPQGPSTSGAGQHSPGLVAPRPWLALYGVRLRPKIAEPQHVELADVQRLIPDELMLVILSKLDPYSLGKAGLVCRHWRVLSEHPRLWENACLEAFRLSVPDYTALARLMATRYRYSWKRMFVSHPHLRFSGLYVSRNTYVKSGVVEFTNHRPVHLVSYFRYYRFFPDGTLLYRTSPQVVSKVAKSLRGRDTTKLQAGSSIESSAYRGRYVIKDAKVYCLVVYPNSRSTEIRMRLALRSTHAGANNRLDVESIVTFDRELGTSTPMGTGCLLGRPRANPAVAVAAATTAPGLEPDAEPGEQHGGSATAHSRGMAPCVFVPWEHVVTTPLNLPAQQMDFYVTG